MVWLVKVKYLSIMAIFAVKNFRNRIKVVYLHQISKNICISAH